MPKPPTSTEAAREDRFYLIRTETDEKWLISKIDDVWRTNASIDRDTMRKHYDDMIVVHLRDLMRWVGARDMFKAVVGDFWSDETLQYSVDVDNMRRIYAEKHAQTQAIIDDLTQFVSASQDSCAGDHIHKVLDYVLSRRYERCDHPALGNLRNCVLPTDTMAYREDDDPIQ